MLVLTLPKAEPSKHQVKKIPVMAGEGSGSGAQQREPQGAGRK
jgi:hypothetical protein